MAKTITTLSHPVWVRGLKHDMLLTPINMVLVAPRVGAWIETHHATGNNTPTTSHPVWVRGLKHPHPEACLAVGGVAPRVGAWIET